MEAFHGYVTLSKLQHFFFEHWAADRLRSVKKMLATIRLRNWNGVFLVQRYHTFVDEVLRTYALK